MPAVACCSRALVAQRDAIDTGSDELRNFWLQLQPWSCAWPRLLEGRASGSGLAAVAGSASCCGRGAACWRRRRQCPSALHGPRCRVGAHDSIAGQDV